MMLGKAEDGNETTSDSDRVGASYEHRNRARRDGI